MTAISHAARSAFRLAAEADFAPKRLEVCFIFRIPKRGIFPFHSIGFRFMFDNMLVRNTLLAALVAGIGMFAATALAKSADAQKFLGAFGHWRAYSFHENGRPVCYISLQIPDGKSHGAHHGNGRLTITQRPSDGARDVVSYTPGYVFRSDSSVSVSVGNNRYELFTAKDAAWARDATTDRKLTADLRAARVAAFKGLPSRRGAMPVRQTVDLSGADAAYRASAGACGIKLESERKNPPPHHGKKAVKRKPRKPHEH